MMSSSMWSRFGAVSGVTLSHITALPLLLPSGLCILLPAPLEAAVAEMPAGYDQLMIPVINNVHLLCLVMILTIPIAMFAMRMAERALKKPASVLNFVL